MFTGPISWAVGLIYIVYDSWLLGYMVMTSRRSVRQDLATDPFAKSETRVTVSVLVAARNERSVLPQCLDALFRQSDSPDEIIVVDDGSMDATSDWMDEVYQTGRSGRHRVSAVNSTLKLLCKEHSGKARSLNEAMEWAQGDVIVTIDADTLLEREAIRAMRLAFSRDADLMAACGVLVPQCQRTLSGRVFQFYQTFEYLRGFLWRLAWMRSDMLLLISGACAAYRKSALKELGGYNPSSLVEDYDLIYRLYRFSHDRGLRWKARVISAARASTDAPRTPKTFLQQRTRWFAGFLETLFKNSDMVGDSRYRQIGRMMLPIKVIDSLLPIYALTAAFFLVYFLGIGKPISPFIWGVIVVKALYDLIFHCWAIILYQKWQGIPLSRKLWAKSLLATLTEPIAFQILRHLGAVLGWIAFLRGKIQWEPQRTSI